MLISVLGEDAESAGDRLGRLVGDTRTDGLERMLVGDEAMEKFLCPPWKLMDGVDGDDDTLGRTRILSEEDVVSAAVTTEVTPAASGTATPSELTSPAKVILKLR